MQEDVKPTYINPFDPDETAQISVRMADLVVGEYDLSDMSHELRVRRLSALIEIYEATLKLGDLEHTADWDWRITITTNDGQLIPDETPEDATVMCDSIELPYEVEPNDYTSAFERWQILNVEVYDWAGDTSTSIVPIAIDDIHTISVEVL